MSSKQYLGDHCAACIGVAEEYIAANLRSGQFPSLRSMLSKCAHLFQDASMYIQSAVCGLLKCLRQDKTAVSGMTCQAAIILHDTAAEILPQFIEIFYLSFANHTASSSADTVLVVENFAMLMKGFEDICGLVTPLSAGLCQCVSPDERPSVSGNGLLCSCCTLVHLSDDRVSIVKRCLEKVLLPRSPFWLSDEF